MAEPFTDDGWHVDCKVRDRYETCFTTVTSGGLGR